MSKHSTWTEADVAKRLQAGSVRVVATGQPAHELPVGWVVHLTLPYPPTENHLYPTGTDGRRHLSAAGKAYHRLVGQAVLTQWPQYAMRPLAAPVALSLCITRPDRRRRDLLNLPKCLADALKTAGVWVDDSQIQSASVRWETRGAELAHVKAIITVLREDT